MSEGGFSPEISTEKASVFTKEDRAHLKNIAQRDQFTADREERAKRHNKERSFWQRLFGRNKHSEKTVAHKEALEMDRSIGQEEAEGTQRKEVVRRVSQRPEFRLTGEVRATLDDIGNAIARNSFGSTKELLESSDFWKGVDESDVPEVHEHVSKLVATQMRELAKKGDSKHFVASVLYLYDYLKRDDFPEELMPKMQEMVAEQLIENCTREKSKSFAEILVLANRFGIYQEPEGDMLRKLQARALTRVEEELQRLENGSEKDPRIPLWELSSLMDANFITEEQVRGNADIFKQIQDALREANSEEYDSVDEPLEGMVADLSERFMGEKKD